MAERTIFLSLICVTLLSLAPLLTHAGDAQAAQVYGGVSFTESRLLDHRNNYQIHDYRGGYKLAAGLAYNSILALEGSYQHFGDFSKGLHRAHSNVYGYVAALRLAIPQTTYFSTYVKVGELFYQVDSTDKDGNPSESNGNHVMFGAGLLFQIAPHLQLTQELDYYHTAHAKIYQAGFGLRGNFGL